MQKIILFISISFFSALAYSQTITGHVMIDNGKGGMESIPGANITWVGTLEGTISDADGFFSIEKTSSTDLLRISFTGYEPDTIQVGNKTALHVMLEPLKNLPEVEITGQQSALNVNTSSGINSVTLSKTELLKAACCNLSESFETSMTVDAEYKDAITGARTIKLLGLDGVYSQIMTENMQVVRGLSSAYGLTYIPGSWIESIQISKGPGSVVNGYEGISGSINTELKKPYETDIEKYFFNLYGNTAGRYEANLNIAQKLNDKWSTMLLFNTTQAHTKQDNNNDGFLDMPLTENYLLMNRWNFSSGKIHEAQAGIKFVFSDIQGGQSSFNAAEPRTINNGYGVGIDTRRLEAYIKNGFVFTRPNTSIGLILNGSSHDQKSFFGLQDYNANEVYLNANLIGQTYIFNTNHLLKAGGSILSNQINESYRSIDYMRNELVPGVFAEYNYSQEEKWNILAGARVDFHNLYGTFFSPRLHAKYTTQSNTTIRASVGKAYRVANPIAENTSLLTSSRLFVIDENLLPEQAWNYGLTLVQKLYMQNKAATITLDAYRTNFINQVVIDMDTDPENIIVGNLKGRSYSNILQAELNQEIFTNFNLRLAYRYSDVQSTFNEQLNEVPYVYKNRGLININYSLEDWGWVLDATMQYYGSARLPDLSGNPEAEFLQPYSPDYVIILAQITKKFKDLELYVGSENITNYTQKNPVIGFNDPFGPNFDASVVYAPVMDRIIYAGLRFTIKENK